MWWQREKPPLCLRMLSPVYQNISQYEQKKRLGRVVAAKLPVISVGNITVGGSGKTPFVVWLALKLKQQGWQPVVVCRGDGGTSERVQRVTADSRACDVGDEAVLLYRLTVCAVLSAKNRVHAAEMAANLGDVMILDDGFQYRQLQRTCDIVLIPDEGVGNGCLLPAGPLREPVQALERADVLVRSGSALCAALSEAKEWRWHANRYALNDWMAAQKPQPQRVLAVTAIARPHRFVDALQSLGLDVCNSCYFPDHYAFTATDVQRFLALGVPVVVTAKDAVKLKDLWEQGTPLWVLEQESEGEEGLFAAIAAYMPK